MVTPFDRPYDLEMGLQYLARYRAPDVPNHEPSIWLRNRIDNLWAWHQFGSVDCCPHLESRQPTPFLLLAPRCGDPGGWDAWTARAPSFGKPDDPDRPCDRCGTTDVQGVVHNFFAPTYGLVIRFCLCHACSELEVPS